MCTVLLPPGVNPFAVHKYSISIYLACAVVAMGSGYQLNEVGLINMT